MNRPRKTDRHLPRNVYFRHGAYYLVRQGKWVRLGTDLAVALHQYGLTTNQKSGGMPDLIDKVLQHTKPGLSKATNTQYRLAGEVLKRKLAEFNPQQVLPKHVAAIKVSMVATPNMANRTLSLLRIVFAHALEWQLVDSNPCVGIIRYKEKKRERYLTDDEYTRIFRVAPARLRVIMALLYLTGQRVSDVLSIRRADILPEAIVFKQQKTGVKLMVQRTPDLDAAIADAKALHDVEGLLLLRGRLGKPLNYRSVREQWDRACEAANVFDAHLHDLRAKSLTDAKRQGFDPQALGGHSSAAMTARYIRLRETPVVDGPSFAKKA